jgi:transposase
MVKMRRIRLTAMEQAQLDQIFKTTQDRRLRDRCQAVLMASRGRKRKIIAQDLGVHRTTVRLWLKQYQEHGLEGLPIHWAPGRPGRIPETLAPTIQGWVQEGPQGCGLARANWTYEELATHLYQTTGIEVKRTAMRVFCQRHDMRPYRPTYRYLRGDPEKQQVARDELAALKKSASRGMRAPKPRRSALSVSADVEHHLGGQGASAAGGDLG